MFKELKERVLRIAKQSFEEELFAGTSGNLSLYDREKSIMIITPSSIPYQTMKVDDIVVMKLDGTILEGNNKPSSEWRMHAMIYDRMPEVGGVVHTHSPYATSFAVVQKSIPAALDEVLLIIGGSIPVAEYAIPGTTELGEKAVQALQGGTKACLLANHGVLAIGKNLELAHISAVYAEDAAKIYSLALSNGTPVIIPEKYQKILLDFVKARK